MSVENGYGGNDYRERLATVETKMEALCDRFERFAEKIESKFDELLKSTLDRPHCIQRALGCELKIKEVEERLTNKINDLDGKIELRVKESLDRHSSIFKQINAIEQDRFPKSTVLLLNVFTFIIGCLLTVITSKLF